MRRPQAGDTYEFVVPAVMGGSGELYVEGDTLRLLEPTGQDPFGQGALVGVSHNWLVLCKYFTPPANESVWASIEHMLGRGLIRLVV